MWSFSFSNAPSDSNTFSVSCNTLNSPQIKNMNTENQEVLTKKGISFGLITLVTVIVVVGLWIANYYLLKDSSDERKKSFGDIFNPLNTLYSGLALSGIVLTILLQRIEASIRFMCRMHGSRIRWWINYSGLRILFCRWIMFLIRSMWRMDTLTLIRAEVNLLRRIITFRWRQRT